MIANREGQQGWARGIVLGAVIGHSEGGWGTVKGEVNRGGEGVVGGWSRREGQGDGQSRGMVARGTSSRGSQGGHSKESGSQNTIQAAKGT